jgi:hypothetical protein
MRETIGLAVAAFMVTVLAASMARADEKETLKLMLINGGAIIGQSIACGVAKDRLLKVMTAHAATVEVLSNGDAKVMKLRDDIIKLAADNEKSLAVQRCGVIETAFSSFEKTLKDRGLMR